MRVSVARNALLSSGGGFLNAALNATILAISAYGGQVDDIASYTVINSSLLLLAVLSGGGASLLYMSGDETQRLAARSQWIIFVLPSLTLGTVAATLFYTERGYTWPSLVASGVVVIGNNLNQFQAGDLTRELRFMACTLVTCGSKALGLLLVVLDFRMTLALAIATVVQVVIGEIAIGKSSWFRGRVQSKVSLARAMSAYSTNRSLLGFTIAELYTSRIASIVMSLFVSPAVMGSFGAVVSIYQALAGVLDTALRAPMSAKIRRRQGIDKVGQSSRNSVLLIIGTSVAVAVAVVLVSPFVIRVVLRLHEADAVLWLVAFCVAFPLFAINRSVTLGRVADGRYQSASRVVWITALAMTPAVAYGIPVWGGTGAAAATVAAELVTTVVLAWTFRTDAKFAPLQTLLGRNGARQSGRS